MILSDSLDTETAWSYNVHIVWHLLPDTGHKQFRRQECTGSLSESENHWLNDQFKALCIFQQSLLPFLLCLQNIILKVMEK